VDRVQSVPLVEGDDNTEADTAEETAGTGRSEGPSPNGDRYGPSDDGTGNQQAGQADDREHAANDQSDGVDQERYTRAAAAQLRVSWHERCSCGT